MKGRRYSGSSIAALLLTISTEFVLTLGTTEARAGEESHALSQADLEAIRAALLEHLHASSLGDRDELIALTQKARGVIDPDGTKHIGFWDFDTSSGVVLVLRLVSGPDLIVNYRSSVRKDEHAWRVGAVEAQFVHGR